MGDPGIPGPEHSTHIVVENNETGPGGLYSVVGRPRLICNAIRVVWSERLLQEAARGTGATAGLHRVPGRLHAQGRHLAQRSTSVRRFCPGGPLRLTLSLVDELERGGGVDVVRRVVGGGVNDRWVLQEAAAGAGGEIIDFRAEQRVAWSRRAAGLIMSLKLSNYKHQLETTGTSNP